MGSDRNIILYPNVSRDIGLEMTRKVKALLEGYSRKAVICKVFDDDVTSEFSSAGFDVKKLGDELEAAEMIITFGGDGTILRAARAAAGTPILGINMGGKGFIADLEVDEINLVNLAASGAYETESRMMLDAEVARDGEIIYRDFALNDIVLRGDNKVIHLILYDDEHVISNFSGDGAIVATPTGSTAYSLAAGGPIVEPSARNIIVTPICAHELEAKPFVLASDRRVSVEVGHKKHSPAYMSADGGEHFEIRCGDRITVWKSDRYTRLVRLSSKSFYSKVSEKLGEKQ